MAGRDRTPVIELWLSIALIALLPALMAIAQVQSEFEVGPKFDNVVRGDKYIGAEVATAGGMSFEIRDALIEPSSGAVVLVVLSEKGGDQMIAVPTAVLASAGERPMLEADVDDGLRAKSRSLMQSETFPLPAVNTFLAATFPQHKLPVKQDGADSGSSNMIRFSKLAGLTIVDNSDAKVGSIDTAVIDVDKARVAYLLVEIATDKKLRAIPLGAFEYYYSPDTWKINLSSEHIANFPPVSSDQLPKVLDRGWVEYIAVRFGRNTLQDPVATEGR